MAVYTEDTGAYPIMVALTACVATELEKRHLPAAGKVTLQVGQSPSIDYVGLGKDCAELIVNLMTSFPVGNFPEADSLATCGSPLAYTVQVSLLRCAPVLRAQGKQPPSMEDQLESTRLHLADMQAVRAAIACCFADTDRQYVLGTFIPYAGGNVVGGVWTITFSGP